MTKKDSSNFKKKVTEIVIMIPKGMVVSYGQVALYIGIPRAARQVGWTLNRMEEVENIPWWRVVNNKGRISIKGSKYSALEQKYRLLKEGVVVHDDLSFDIEKYRYIPDVSVIKRLGLDSLYLDMISKKISYSNYFPKNNRR